MQNKLIKLSIFNNAFVLLKEITDFKNFVNRRDITENS